MMVFNPYEQLPNWARKPFVLTVYALAVIGNLIEGYLVNDLLGFIVAGVILLAAILVAKFINFSD